MKPARKDKNKQDVDGKEGKDDEEEIFNQKKFEVLRPPENIKSKLLPHIYNIYRPKQAEEEDD